MFFDTPPHDPAPRHNKGLSYGASYEFCHAKLLHRKLTKYLSRALAVVTPGLSLCHASAMHHKFQSWPSFGDFVVPRCTGTWWQGKIEVRE
jgi:hypothetical protein